MTEPALMTLAKCAASTYRGSDELPERPTRPCQAFRPGGTSAWSATSAPCEDRNRPMD